VNSCTYVNGVYCEVQNDPVNCPKFQVINAVNVCQASCTLELTGECFVTCPQGYIASGAVCVACTNYYNNSTHTCDSEAPHMIYTLVNGNKILVTNCETGFYFQDNVNVTHCEKDCQTINPTLKYAVNGLCVPTCFTSLSKFVANSSSTVTF
jgi:hypothetical protein